MSVFAAVMTGQSMGAIATLQLFGGAAETILQRVFRPKGNQSFAPAEGRIMLGSIIDGDAILDEVTVGCEGPHTFALHCHGNPLLVARIMELLRRQGAQTVPAEQLLAKTLASRKAGDAIAVEAQLALTTVKTMEGAALIANQVGAGLSRKIRQWRDRLDSTPLETIAAEAGDILKHSESARLIISGCTIALVGPPNTGKSTLLNTLAGREKAIVSDIRGTTRDWVSAEIHIPPLAATIIDTAGLDALLASADSVDQVAQQKSMETIRHADLILLVLDLSQPAGQLPASVFDQLVGRRVVTVLNKADLSSRLDPEHVPGTPGPTVRISAKQGTGINELIYAIHHVCGVGSFDMRASVVFTNRQRHLLESLQRSEAKADARSVLSELLESPVAFSS